MRYKWSINSLAWLFHRITGIVLSFYLIAHIYVLSHLKDPESYNRLMGMMKNPIVKIGELGLFAVVLIHVFAGLRVTFLEAGISTKYQKHMAYTGAVFIALVWFIGAVYFLKEVF